MTHSTKPLSKRCWNSIGSLTPHVMDRHGSRQLFREQLSLAPSPPGSFSMSHEDSIESPFCHLVEAPVSCYGAHFHVMVYTHRCGGCCCCWLRQGRFSRTQ